MLAPGAILAQPRARSWRIGYLMPGRRSTGDDLEAGIAEWFGGSDTARRQVRIEVRAADDDFARLPALAAELVAAKVDIIVAASPPAIRAASQATRAIPIVMAFWGGPGLLESGIIKSFARPGTNVTGIYMLATELDLKRLELLTQALPQARKIGILNAGAQWGDPLSKRRSETLLSPTVELWLTPVPGSDGYERVFEAMAKEHVDAVVVPSFPRFAIEQAQVIQAAAKYRIPAIYEWGDMARGGGFMAYGPVLADLRRDVARYVDRIVKGARPADLSVEQPTRFELVVNMATAKTLGIAFPQAVLVRADDVIR